MALRNQLFFIILAFASITGCGTVRHSATIVTDVPPTSASLPAVDGAGAAEGDTDILFHALMAAGVDYRRGGRSYQSGFDCSGLVAHVFQQAYGLALPHNSKAQSEWGEAVDRSDLRPGDLVFFNTLGAPFSHVGIYIGEGRFIHAPKEGAVVRTEVLQARYWSQRYDGARRVVTTIIAAGYPQPAKKPAVTYP
jgi:cell wall-associated NlpC family hydrolase